MESFLIANPKGGSGKSTLATNLAGWLARQGHRVMLGDTDRQQSSREWLRLRPPTLPRIDSWDIQADSPARPHGKRLAQLLKIARRVSVPLQPSLFDILATRHFLDGLLEEKAVRRQQTFIAVVAMRVDARTRAALELERFLAALQLPVLAHLRDTQNYVQAAAHG